MNRSANSSWRTSVAWLVLVLTAVANPMLYPHQPQQPAAWAGMCLVLILAVSGKLAKGFWLGFLTALAVGLHPAFRSAQHNQSAMLLTATAGVAVLIPLLLALQQMTVADRRWSWLLIAIVLGVSLSLIWFSDLWVAAVALVGTLATLLLALFAGFPHGEEKNAQKNRIALAIVAVSVPAFTAAVLWTSARLRGQSAVDLLPRAEAGNWRTMIAGWDETLSSSFAVPGWALATVLLWAWWRTARCGWRQRREHRPPTAWAVTVWTLVVAAFFVPLPGSAGIQPLLVAWAVFLLAFLIVDLLQGLARRLVLPPPAN